MDSSNKSCDTLLKCGSLSTHTKTFNRETKIEQVHDHVRQFFDSNLPNSYEIVYYDTTTMSFVNLEDQLQNGLNPFELNSSTGVESTTSPIDCIRLYVVSNAHFQSGKNNDLMIRSKRKYTSEVQDDETVSNSTDNEIQTKSGKSFIIKYLQELT